MAQLDKVRILRVPERTGLIRARLAGIAEASAKILTFLDSHCEVVTQYPHLNNNDDDVSGDDGLAGAAAGPGVELPHHRGQPRDRRHQRGHLPVQLPALRAHRGV